MTFPTKQITSGFYYHFFGYYDKSNWDKTGRYLLALRTAPFKRYMEPEDLAIIGVLDSERDYAFTPISQTTAWNWQQGAQAVWLDNLNAGFHFIHNVRTADDYASVVVNSQDPTETRQLPLPIYSVTPDSKHALCLNYRRFRYTHSTIGYAAAEVERPPSHPTDDGLALMDIETGEHKIVISLEDLYQLEHDPSMGDACHWITHVNTNPSGDRVAFLHRFKQEIEGKTVIATRLVAADLNGSNMMVLGGAKAPFTCGFYLSHPKWFGDDHVMVWHGNGCYDLHKDKTTEAQAVGTEQLNKNGHFSPCPVNPDWFLADTYPDESGMHPLFLYQVSTDTRVLLREFRHDPEIGGDTRCDLHPRWSRDGKAICVDSSMNNDRQMYIVDVSEGPHLK